MVSGKVPVQKRLGTDRTGKPAFQAAPVVRAVQAGADDSPEKKLFLLQR